MLERLAEIRWDRLEHAYGSASDIPDLLLALTSKRPGKRRESLVECALRERPEAWVDFMMRFELGLEAPEPGRALRSALTIAGSYVAGGLIPLLPYLLLTGARPALWLSVAMTLAALSGFKVALGPAFRAAG